MKIYYYLHFVLLLVVINLLPQFANAQEVKIVKPGKGKPFIDNITVIFGAHTIHLDEYFDDIVNEQDTTTHNTTPSKIVIAPTSTSYNTQGQTAQNDNAEAGGAENNSSTNDNEVNTEQGQIEGVSYAPASQISPTSLTPQCLNPATEELILNLPLSQKDYKIVLYNTAGQIVLTHTSAGNILKTSAPISHLPAGAYLLWVTNNDQINTAIKLIIAKQ